MCRHGCAAQGPASEYKADIAQKPEYVCFGAEAGVLFSALPKHKNKEWTDAQ